MKTRVLGRPRVGISTARTQSCRSSVGHGPVDLLGGVEPGPAVLDDLAGRERARRPSPCGCGRPGGGRARGRRRSWPGRSAGRGPRGSRTRRRPASAEPSVTGPAGLAVDDLDQVEQQGQRGHQAAVLGQVALDQRALVLGAELLVLQVRARQPSKRSWASGAKRRNGGPSSAGRPRRRSAPGRARRAARKISKARFFAVGVGVAVDVRPTSADGSG